MSNLLLGAGRWSSLYVVRPASEMREEVSIAMSIKRTGPVIPTVKIQKLG